MEPFDSQLQTRIVFGNNTVERLGELTRELGGQRVLLVTDRGVIAAGHADRARQSLEAAGLEVGVFDAVRQNPTTVDVAGCVEAARSHRADFLVGFGGGSSMDTAKGCNFIFTNGGRMEDYRGVGKATKPMLPFIAVPTTAGTGSECQSAALVANENTHGKMACLDRKALARVAILDPVLTLSQPPRVTACTGIDAIAHTVETAVTTKRNAVSGLYSREAFRLLMGAFPLVLRDPGNLEARGDMLLGAAFAGIAVENSMLGAAHAAANPLTAHYNVVHGQAVGLLLPRVVRFNAADPVSRLIYAEWSVFGGLVHSNKGFESAVDALIERLETLLVFADFPRSLSECGVERRMLERLAREAAGEWTATFNPRRMAEGDFANLYEAAFVTRE